ncbi:Ig-like domain-containing protein [Pseudomonas aeruginosa]|uniref:Ig-like domain-containing protein n=1 Tax=Pseudomonas aeruginosa TaxID=287 RepID=UPI000FFE3DDB|nr:Ig-like domain-containing protein [Pseudomonas aeruginosa]MBA5107603.1 Ig-like domain-containing protein [Pseudomonas aeruginosa]MBD1300853.1 Ig-like domain-containing protein [Pseudomonas aeruginosa]MBD1341622.1 Ig-like domain-containing protein [Pseudomonas aeruginosa]MDP5993423.1 Ig-like domain-containing protein [Pseudomonas aeruginosa]HCE9175686.1 Ig-like domain-containing protein [Pseudomonas aeruginosa]
MQKMRLLALSIAAALASGPAVAAVVCEFEPSQDLNDCSRCFKADVDGVSLFLDGKRVASSTDADRLQRVRIGRTDYQRGVEKALFSQRHGAAKLYEVCYSSERPVQALDLDLEMQPGAEIQEFQLQVEGSMEAQQYAFRLASTVSPVEGSVGLFGNTLVFQPASTWSGSTTLQYEVVDSSGRSRRANLTVHEDSQTASLRAERDALTDLQNDLLAVEAELGAEMDYGGEIRSRVDALELAVASEQERVSRLNQQISLAQDQLRLDRTEARLKGLLGVSEALPQDIELGVILSHNRPRDGRGWMSAEIAIEHLQAFLVPRFARHKPFTPILGQEPVVPKRRRRQRLSNDASNPRRRLSKREKKRAKRARAKRSHLGV